MTQSRYYDDLAAKLIDNTFDDESVRNCESRAVPAAELEPFCTHYSLGVHLIPNLKRSTWA